MWVGQPKLNETIHVNNTRFVMIDFLNVKNRLQSFVFSRARTGAFPLLPKFNWCLCHIFYLIRLNDFINVKKKLQFSIYDKLLFRFSISVLGVLKMPNLVLHSVYLIKEKMKNMNEPL